MMHATLCTLALGLAALNAPAQNVDGQSPAGGKSPLQGERPEGQRPAELESLTPGQQARVTSILSKYNKDALTAADAKAINDAFRASGIRNGPALQQAIKHAGFVPERIGELDPPPGPGEPQPRPQEPPEQDRTGPNRRDAAQGAPERRGPGQGGGYSLEQAVSDRAQLATIAFDGLAFLTGDFGGNTFLPPGKVADFCGFQYMRDVDTNQLGHNTSFVPRIANNVLAILTEGEKAKLVALAKEQEKPLAEFARGRFPLIKAFCRLLAGEIPAGSDGLSREAVMAQTARIFAIDGTLSYRRAEVVGGIIRDLTKKQKDALGKMAFDNSATWPDLPDQIDKKSLSPAVHVAVMTYASEMFSWYAGNVEADVYFCPERHATYFGSFYMKDIPAMGNPNYSISTSLTGDSGEAFLAALTESQRAMVTNLVDQQRADLAEIVTTRRAIATELRRFMKVPSIDEVKVAALAKRYGELDGEISYFYATAFARVGKTLTAEQKGVLLKLRNLDEKYTGRGAYLYSQPIAMPEVKNTDDLFGAARK